MKLFCKCHLRRSKRECLLQQTRSRSPGRERERERESGIVAVTQEAAGGEAKQKAAMETTLEATEERWRTVAVFKEEEDESRLVELL